MRRPDGFFVVNHSRPTAWTHVVLNYSGTAVILYYNKAEVNRDPALGGSGSTPGNDRVAIGRRSSDVDSFYDNIAVDELIFFNRQLGQEEIDDIYNMYP